MQHFSDKSNFIEIIFGNISKFTPNLLTKTDKYDKINKVDNINNFDKFNIIQR